MDPLKSVSGVLAARPANIHRFAPGYRVLRGLQDQGLPGPRAEVAHSRIRGITRGDTGGRMSILSDIAASLQRGEDEEVASLVRQALDDGQDAVAILHGGLIAGMGVVGEQFREREIFLPDVLLAARAMYAGLALLPGEAPESLNLTQAGVIEEIASLYVEAGADLITTNTFGGSPARLRQFGLDGQTEAVDGRGRGGAPCGAGTRLRIRVGGPQRALDEALRGRRSRGHRRRLRTADPRACRGRSRPHLHRDHDRFGGGGACRAGRQWDYRTCRSWPP